MAERFTPSEVAAFFASPLWAEIRRRHERELHAVDEEIENPDPFLHGRATGKRYALRLLGKYQAALTQEAEGKAPYGRAR